jgi:nucleotidyltransferase substrate binding protein (TIGR01987 family)
LRLRGIQVNSPVLTFREAYQEKLIDDKDIFKSMLEDRNAVTHEYFQQQAEEIYKRLPGYLKAMRKIYENIERIYRNNEITL